MKPENGRLIIAIDKRDKTDGGIALPKKDIIAETATVMESEPGSSYKKGCKVDFKAYCLETVKDGTEERHYLREEDVLGSEV